MTTTKQSRSGATLVEVAVSSVLVGVLLVAALDTVGSSARTHLAASKTAEAWALAEMLAAEVLAMPYEDPNGSAVFGIEAAEGSPTIRAGLDDVDDYHNWTESPPKSRDGAPLARYTGWTAKVLVTLGEASPTDGDIADVGSDQGLKRVRFRITDPTGRVVDVDTVRTRHGARSTPPVLSLPLASTLSIEATVGGTVRQHHAEQLINEAPLP